MLLKNKITTVGNKLKFLIALLILLGGLTIAQDQGYNYSQKNGILAATLSIQPLPIDLGNFYAGYWEKALLYSAGEMLLFIPGAVMLSNGSNSGDSDQAALLALISSYVMLKVISAVDVGVKISLKNRKIPSYNPTDYTKLFDIRISL